MADIGTSAVATRQEDGSWHATAGGPVRGGFVATSSTDPDNSVQGGIFCAPPVEFTTAATLTVVADCPPMVGFGSLWIQVTGGTLTMTFTSTNAICGDTAEPPIPPARECVVSLVLVAYSGTNTETGEEEYRLNLTGAALVAGGIPSMPSPSPFYVGMETLVIPDGDEGEYIEDGRTLFSVNYELPPGVGDVPFDASLISEAVDDDTTPGVGGDEPDDGPASDEDASVGLCKVADVDSVPFEATLVNGGGGGPGIDVPFELTVYFAWQSFS